MKIIQKQWSNSLATAGIDKGNLEVSVNNNGLRIGQFLFPGGVVLFHEYSISTSVRFRFIYKGRIYTSIHYSEKKLKNIQIARRAGKFGREILAKNKP